MNIVYCPAKLNLFLQVYDKRPDNYHNIITLMTKVGIYDRIEYSISEVPGLKLNTNIQSINNKNNIVYKVFDLLSKIYTNMLIKPGLNMYICKQNILGTGLGLGSSNAAYVFKIFNQHYDLRLSKKDIIKYSNILGSDIVFFLEDFNSAVCTGIGNIITPIVISKSIWFVVIFPNIECSSKAAYCSISSVNSNLSSSELSKYKSKGLKNAYDIVNLLNREGDREKFSKFIFNSFEKIQCEKYITLKTVKNNVSKINNILFSSISGSGSSFYMVFYELSDAKNAYMYLKQKYKYIYLVSNNL